MIARSPKTRSARSSPPLCLIPARGGSKRFPRKNVAPLKGRPLLSYSISAARASGLFEEVYVSTDDGEIARIAAAEGATVLERPEALAGDQARVIDVALHALDVFEDEGRIYDNLCVVYATAPLMSAEDLQGGWKLFNEKRANSVMAVTPYYEHPLQALVERGRFLRPVFPKAMVPRQKLPDYQVDIGYFYFIRSKVLRQRRNFYVPRLAGYPIPRLRAVDIDEPEHLKVVEALMGISSGRSV